MHSINNKINILSDYLNGFNDLYEHESVGKTACGLLKVASYFVFILPVIAGVALHFAKAEAKQARDLMERVDAAIDNEETQTVGGVAIRVLKPASQDDFIAFLLMKVEDNDFGEAYQRAFKKLELPSQEKFFLRMIAASKLGEALDGLPADIKELKFSCGIHLDEGDKSAANARVLISKLSRFTALDQVELNFSAIGCFTSRSRDYLTGLVHSMRNFDRVSKHSTWDEVEYVSITGPSFCGDFSYLHTNRLAHVKETVEELLFGLKNKDFTINNLQITHNDLNDGHDYGIRHDIVLKRTDQNSYAIRHGNACGRDGFKGGGPDNFSYNGSIYSYTSTTFPVARE